MRQPFPPQVEDFLDPDSRRDSVGCLTSLCTGPAATLKWAYFDIIHDKSLDGTEGGEGDERFAQLLLSGLVQACLDGIECADECPNRPVEVSKQLFRTGINIDAPWEKIVVLRREGDPSIPSGFEGAIAMLRRGSPNCLSTTLVGLALLKMAISSIRFLGRHGGEHPDAGVTVPAVRLLARCLAQASGDEFDYDLISAGADTEIWASVAEVAREEHESGGAASRYVSTAYLPRVLEPPSEEDRALLSWLLWPGVFSAVGGWMKGGAWKRSPEVAAVAPSWRRLRELLLVGDRGSRGRLSEQELKRETDKASEKLKITRLEERDGSTSLMPLVNLPCAARECSNDGTKLCTGCRAISYCSKSCQKLHWRASHKKMCSRKYTKTATI